MKIIDTHSTTVWSSAMSYDLEKYRDKRERVLGVKKRGISFGTIATIVSLVILVGLGAVIIPKSIAYFQVRNLEDAIYKLENSDKWHDGMVAKLKQIHAIKTVSWEQDKHRVVITFDNTMTDTDMISALFKKEGFDTVLLNQMDHASRKELLKKEAAFESGQ